MRPVASCTLIMYVLYYVLLYSSPMLYICILTRFVLNNAFDEQEAGWCQRIKHDFTFHYEHLEDAFDAETK